MQLPLPRMEQLCEKLGLDTFERDVLLLLAGHALSPVIQQALRNEEALKAGRRAVSALPLPTIIHLPYSPSSPAQHHPNTNMGTRQVDTILTVFFPSFQDQIEKRSYFYKSATLVKRGTVVWYNLKELSRTIS
jgi:hypothetical protein